MKDLIFLFLISLSLSCNTNKQISLNEKESSMIAQLSEIKQEDKFIEGSNGWEGYSGCKNPIEKRAYSDNINSLIDNLIKAIEEKESVSHLKNLIDEHSLNGDKLLEEFKADTDESEIQFMYFERIKKICEVS